MRIAINGYFLTQPATGSGEHLYGLLEGLDALDEPNDYRVLYPHFENTGILRVPPLGPAFQIREIGGMARRLGLRLGKLWWEQVALRQVCVSERVDLLHSPYFASPLVSNVPTLVTIHDVIPLVLRDYGRQAHVKVYMKLVVAAARRAKAVLTVSEASRADIVRVLGIDPARVHVVYNAVDASLRPVHDRAALEWVRDAHGIAEEFLLYFGGFDLRKNVRGILAAFRTARQRFHRPCQLVLAGSLSLVGHPLYPDPRRLIQELGMESAVVVTGRISEEEKPLLYSAATAFVFPSLYEGFGMPVLEAMACGAAVITSNSSALPEVTGDAAVLVDPTKVEAIGDAMLALLQAPERRAALGEAARARAAHFSWGAVAQQTLEVYAWAANGRTRGRA